MAEQNAQKTSLLNNHTPVRWPGKDIATSVFSRNLPVILLILLLFFTSLGAADTPTAESSFHVTLPPHPHADDLLLASPFGINTAFQPDTPNLEAILQKMKEAGIKWGRQDFTWRRIEKKRRQYQFQDYDRLVDKCQSHGLLLFGNLAYAPKFYDPTTPRGVHAYCDFVTETVKHFAGKVKYWQIWNEPNGGFWKGTPQEYARLLAAAGKAIHQADPDAKVLGLNMAFCDVI